MNKIRKISVALSLALGLGLNVQSAMAGEIMGVSKLALLGALQQMDDATLDKDAFVNACQRYGYGLTLGDVAAICLQTVGATGRDNVRVCDVLVNNVAYVQNEYVDLINSGMMRYALDGIRPDKTKISAITPDGAYFASAMEFPDYVDFSQLSDVDAVDLRGQNVIFRASDDLFICAPHIYSEACRANVDSDMYFDLKSGELTMKPVAGWDRSIDYLPVKYAGIKKFEHFGSDGHMGFASDLINDAYEYAAVYDRHAELYSDPVDVAQEEAIRYCEDRIIASTMVDTEPRHTTRCNGSACYVTITNAGMTYQCKFGPNWEKLLDSDPVPVYGLVDVPEPQTGNSTTTRVHGDPRLGEILPTTDSGNATESDSGNMSTHEIGVVEIVGSSSSGRSSNEGRVKGPKEPLPTTDSGSGTESGSGNMATHEIGVVEIVGSSSSGRSSTSTDSSARGFRMTR